MTIIASTFCRKQAKAMIIPTAEFDPLFADDGEPFRSKMLRYIECEFADLLSDRCDLLSTDRGLSRAVDLVTEANEDASRNAA